MTLYTSFVISSPRSSSESESPRENVGSVGASSGIRSAPHRSIPRTKRCRVSSREKDKKCRKNDEIWPKSFGPAGFLSERSRVERRGSPWRPLSFSDQIHFFETRSRRFPLLAGVTLDVSLIEAPRRTDRPKAELSEVPRSSRCNLRVGVAQPDELAPKPSCRGSEKSSALATSDEGLKRRGKRGGGLAQDRHDAPSEAKRSPLTDPAQRSQSLRQLRPNAR